MKESWQERRRSPGRFAQTPEEAEGSGTAAPVEAKGSEAAPVKAVPAKAAVEDLPQNWSPGATVQIQGLVQRPSLNGQMGRLFQWDAAKGRWEILLLDNPDGMGLLIKPAWALVARNHGRRIRWSMSLACRVPPQLVDNGFRIRQAPAAQARQDAGHGAHVRVVSLHGCFNFCVILQLGGLASPWCDAFGAVDSGHTMLTL